MGTCKDQSKLTGPRSEEHAQTDQGQDEPVGSIYPEMNVLNPERRDGEIGKEDVSREAHVPPFPGRLKNPCPTDPPARKKHNAVPPRLLNADPLAQIIGMEAIADDVIIDDAEAFTSLDSGAMTDLMSSAYAEARGFDVRLITELSDQYVNLNLALGYSSTVTGYVEYNLCVKGISSYNSDHVALIAKDTQFSKEVLLTIGTKTEDSIFKAMKEGDGPVG